MRNAIIEIRRKTAALWRSAQADPVKALTVIGAVSLLAYLVFALLPLALPDTDRSHFPPYLALPESDFSLSNYYLLYVFLSGTAFAIFGLYLAGLGVADAGGVSATGDTGRPLKPRSDSGRTLTVIVTFAVLFHLVMLMVPTLLSTDIFDYIRHARILAIYGENPLIIPATYFPHDPFYNMGGWVGTGSVYGPLHIYVTSAIAWVAGDGFSANFFLFRGFFVAMNLVNLYLIWRIAARIKPGLERKALLFFGWNPFILILVVSNAHNDILMLALVLAGFLQYLNRRVLLGALFITMAILVKFIALPILFVYLALALRQNRTLARRLAITGGSLLIFTAVTFLSYLPLWAGRETFKSMTTVGRKANFTLPGLIRDLAAGHFQLQLSSTLIQLTFATLLGAYIIWHIRGVSSFRGLVSASAGIAFLTPFALFWFQPWYLTMALGLIALRPRRLLYQASLAFSFSVMFFDSFWWHTPFSMDIQKPLRVLAVFGPPILFLLIMKTRDILPSIRERAVRWSLGGAGSSRAGANAITDPSRSRMAIEVAALAAAALVPMAAVVSTSPQLRSFVNLVVVKLQLLINI